MSISHRPRRRRPRTTNQPAIDRLYDAKVHLADADIAIDDAIAMLAGDVEPPEPPDETVIAVAPGDDLMAMINAAPPGAVLEIDPAFVGALGDSSIKNSVTLRSKTPPPPDVRVTGDMVGPTITGALAFKSPDIHCIGIRFEGIGMTAISAGDGTLVDRCVVTGPADGGHQQRGIMANAEDVTVQYCHIAGIYKTEDTQAVGCNNHTKRLTVRDCYLEASGENFMSGGDDPSSEHDVPEDILIEKCHFYKPPAAHPDGWKGKPDCAVKNLFELKNARRVVVRDCLFEYSWADAQIGFAVVMTVRNQNGSAPYSTIEDVLFENNTIKHCGGGFQILGRDYTHPSQIMRRVTIRNTTITDLSRAWKEGSSEAAGQAFAITGGPDALTIEDCDLAIEPGSGLKAAIAFDQVQYPATNLVIRRCRMYEGDYGITGQANAPIGVAQLDAHAPGYVWEDVTIVKGTSGRKIAYPPDTTIEG
jgi:hypothetical protein